MDSTARILWEGAGGGCAGQVPSGTDILHHDKTSFCVVSTGRGTLRMGQWQPAVTARGWGSTGQSTGEQKLRLAVIVLPFLFHKSISIYFP